MAEPDEADAMSPSERLARRAADLALRADRLAREAQDAGRTEQELDELDRQLAELQAEQQRLDDELSRLDAGVGTGGRQWAGVDASAGDTGSAGTSEEARAGSYGRPRGGGWSSLGEGLSGWIGQIGEMISDTVVSAVSGSRLGALGRLEAGADVAGARPVVVDNFAGSIRVEAGASGRVEAEAEVRARTQEDVAAVTLTVRPEGDAIQVVCEGGPLPWRNAYARLVVRVPAGSPVDATTRGGSVQVNGTGAEVRARTAGGSIRTSGTAGPADLETQGGSIQMEDHHGPVEAVTMGGSIAMAGRLGPSVSARTAGGSIRVRGVEGTVTADTAGGSVHIDGRLTGDCLVTNVGGSVTVVVPADNGLRVDARGVAVSSDFADLVGGRSELHGTIGAGEDGTLSIRAMAGAVRIRSASPAGRPAAGR